MKKSATFLLITSILLFNPLNSYFFSGVPMRIKTIKKGIFVIFLHEIIGVLNIFFKKNKTYLFIIS